MRGLKVWESFLSKLYPGLVVACVEEDGISETFYDLDVTLLSWWMERESMLHDMEFNYPYAGVDTITLINADRHPLKKVVLQDTFYFHTHNGSDDTYSQTTYFQAGHEDTYVKPVR
jgi:hypothetical protein